MSPLDVKKVRKRYNMKKTNIVMVNKKELTKVLKDLQKTANKKIFYENLVEIKIINNTLVLWHNVTNGLVNATTIEIAETENTNIVKNAIAISDFINLLQSAEREYTEIEINESTVKIENNCILNKYDAEIFDKEEKLLGLKKAEININCNDFFKLIQQTEKGILTEKYGHDILRNFYFEIEDNLLKVTTVNGYKIHNSSKILNINTSELCNINFLLNGERLKAVNKIIKGLKNEDIKISIYDEVAMIQFEKNYMKYNMQIGRSESDFIKYKRYYNNESPENTVILPQKKLMEILKNNKTILKQVEKVGKNSFYIAFTENRMILNIKTHEMTIEKSIELAERSVILDKNMKIGFNPKYFSEGVEAVETGNIVLKFWGELEPIEINNGNDDISIKNIVLPVRLV